MAISSVSHAQEAKDSAAVDYIPEISLDTRLGYNQCLTDKSGRFYSDGIYLNLDGYISPHFSYSSNVKLFTPESFEDGYSGIDAINWLQLTYEIGDFSISAGKDAIFVGSFEYEAYDLDAYYDMYSLFYNYFDCWQWGVSAAWYPAENQSIQIQVANSPLSYEENHFAYSLAWRGGWDWYESYWSANLWQYDSGKYVKSLNLGNMFYLGDFSILADYMTRSASFNTLFSEDFTAVLQPAYEGLEWGRFFVKAGYERASEIIDYEFTGDNLFYGLGAEFFPLKENRNIRLHTTWTHNTQYSGCHILNIGLTWKMDLTRTVKNILNHHKD
jgi:hypothetical protein